MKRIYTPGKISIVKNVAVLIALFFSLMVSQGLKAQVLLTESFDGLTFVPVGWNNILTSGTNTWTRVTSGTFPTQATHSGAGEAKFNSWSANGGVRSMVTPALNFSIAGTKQVSFWMYKDNGYLSTADRVDVLINTVASTVGATTLGTVNRATNLSPTAGSNGWYQYTYTVPVCAPGQTTNCPTQTLTITVTAPSLVNDTNTALANVPKAGNLSTNDTNPAGSTYGQPAQQAGATLTVNADGTYSFTATAAGTYTYTIPVCAPGQTANCPTQTLTITVTAPSLVNDTNTAFANVPKTGNLSTNDTNPAGSTYGQPAQQAGATLHMIDFVTGQLFDWFVSGETAFNLIERLPAVVTGPPNTAGRDEMYTQIIKQFRKAWERNEKDGLDIAMEDISKHGEISASEITTIVEPETEITE